MKKIELFFVLALFTLSPFASADIPHLISLQGKLTDASDNPISSSTNFVFKIYPSETSGTALWTEQRNGANAIVPDTLGIFSALLGSVTALNIPFNESYWLEVEVQSGTGPTQILSPRTRMGSAGYALRSESPWNTTGNTIYTTNAGNVGIGTSSPAQKLTVAGDVNWTGTLQGGNVPWARLASFPSDCSAGQYVYGVGGTLKCSTPAGGISGTGTQADNYIPRWSGTTQLENSVIYQTDAGNVGIWTASPSVKLDVAGTINASAMTVNGSAVEVQANKYVANGYAGLDTNRLVPEAQLRKRAWLSGSTEYYGNGATTATYSSTYVKVKTIHLNHLPNGILRISMWIRSHSLAYVGYARVYRNGVAVGTEQSTTNPFGVTFTENIAGWAEGDNLELYLRATNPSYGIENRGFSILYNETAELSSTIP